MVVFGISVVNVLIGVFVGFFGFCYFNYFEKGFKIVGGIVVGVLIMFGIMLNFFIVYFCDVVEISLYVV